jgi:ABC-type multidrug transport system ATPase subunit
MRIYAIAKNKWVCYNSVKLIYSYLILTFLGYCPQNNPLFDKLTVKEHLKLYAGLKTGRYYGPAGKQALEQEIIHIVEDVGLTPKIDTVIIDYTVPMINP